MQSVETGVTKHGLATGQDLELDTYAERLSAAFRAAGGIMMSPPFIGAWTRKPN